MILGFRDFLNENESPMSSRDLLKQILETISRPFQQDDYECEANLEKGTLKVWSTSDFLSGDSFYSIGLGKPGGVKRPHIDKDNEAVIKVTINERKFKALKDPKEMAKLMLLGDDNLDGIVKFEASVLVSYAFPEFEDFFHSNGDLEEFIEMDLDWILDPDDIQGSLDELAEVMRESIDSFFDELSLNSTTLRKVLDEYEKENF
jgi:hypothetical protein